MAYCSKKCLLVLETVQYQFELSGHFGTSRMMPKCLGSEVSWVRRVLTPHQRVTETAVYYMAYR